MRYLIKGDKNSWDDFGWVIKSWSQPPPDKNEITVTVPYRQGSIRFSKMYGAVPYGDRTVTVVFMRQNPFRKYHGEVSRFVDWLYTEDTQYIRDSWNSRWRLNGRVTKVDTSEALSAIGTITATITASPLLDHVSYSDMITWDNFGFETDVLHYDPEWLATDSNGVSYTMKIANPSPYKTRLYVVPDAGTATITLDGTDYAFTPDSCPEIYIEPGLHEIPIICTGVTSCRVYIREQCL